MLLSYIGFFIRIPKEVNNKYNRYYSAVDDRCGIVIGEDIVFGVLFSEQAENKSVS